MDSSTGRVTTAFLDFAVAIQATARDTFEALNDKMKIYDVNWQNCLAFSSDNASVMLGKHNSVFQRIAEIKPDVYPVGCACHLAHLCAKKAAKELSMDVEQLVINLYYHFDKSSKRKELLKEYQEFCNVETRKILKHSSTRWLSLMKCVDRILRQYEALQSYFASCVEEKKAKKESKVTLLMEKLNDPMTKGYMVFLHSVLPVFDAFTALLECEEPMIHRVGDCITKLTKELLGRFIDLQVIREADSFLEINYTDPTVQVTDRQLRLGLATRQFIRSKDLEGTPAMRKFYQEVRSFFVTALNYIKHNFPHDDEVVKNAIILDVTKRASVDNTNLSVLLERFPGLVEEDELTALENEFLEYQFLSDHELPDTSIVMADGTLMNRRVDEIWNEISQMKNLVTGQERFPISLWLAFWSSHTAMPTVRDCFQWSERIELNCDPP